jgi:hypothetical protein
LHFGFPRVSLRFIGGGDLVVTRIGDGQCRQIN